MAGRIRGLAPRLFTEETTARSASVMQATPRLPADAATLACVASSRPFAFSVICRRISSFAIDVAELDRAWRELQAEVHPDRHAAADDASRRLALQASARVNESYRALKDPVERGRYLLHLRGIDAFDETDTRLPLEFLEAQLERREHAAQAAGEGDVEALDDIVADIRAESRERERDQACRQASTHKEDIEVSGGSGHGGGLSRARGQGRGSALPLRASPTG
jgi:molecular chaperone HscB